MQDDTILTCHFCCVTQRTRMHPKLTPNRTQKNPKRTQNLPTYPQRSHNVPNTYHKLTQNVPKTPKRTMLRQDHTFLTRQMSEVRECEIFQLQKWATQIAEDCRHEPRTRVSTLLFVPNISTLDDRTGCYHRTFGDVYCTNVEAELYTDS